MWLLAYFTKIALDAQIGVTYARHEKGTEVRLTDEENSAYGHDMTWNYARYCEHLNKTWIRVNKIVK